MSSPSGFPGAWPARLNSLTWRGKEFVNDYDHGREISYAWAFDGYGECFNPTEPGAARDGLGPNVDQPVA